MKKFLVIALALIMAFSFTACGGGGNADTNTDAPADNEKPADTQTEPAGSPSDAYSKYIEAKGAAYDRLTAKIEQHDELALTAGMAMLPIVMVDLALLPLTILGVEGGEAALEMFGMQGINIDKDGDIYTITYQDEEGNTTTQTCEFDAKTDSMRSVASDGSKDTLVFEYVNTGDGYASQYTVYSEENGEYSLITSYFNDTDFVGFGIQTVKGEPDSIFKNTGLGADFIKNDESYFMLEGDEMTIFMDGETNTY